MNQPVFTLTWEYAPPWAQWFAFDLDGYAFWYEKKPDQTNDDWVGIGKAEIAINVMRTVHTWKESLIPRPS